MKNTPIQWHPAFFAAVNLELSENRQNLQFAREYNLNVKPLEIDLLITKNDPDTSVNNEIGRIFKGHNILEYKGPGDSLNIDAFFKTEGYACLYKSYGKTLDAIREDDVTVTLVRESKPAGLFSYFTEHGYQISNLHNGIYRITGRIPFLTQVIVTKELNAEQHVWLRALSEKLKKQDMETLMQHVRRLTGKQDKEFADAVLEAAFRANLQIIQELMGDDRMSEELLEMIKPLIEPKILLRVQAAENEGMKKGMNEGMKKGMSEGMKKGMNEGMKKGMNEGMKKGIQGAIAMLRGTGCKDDQIKIMITEQYGLTPEEADGYL